MDLTALESNDRCIVEHLSSEGTGRALGVIAVVMANEPTGQRYTSETKG